MRSENLSEKRRKQVGGKEQDIYDHQAPTRRPGFQTRKQINRGGKYYDLFNRLDDLGIVSSIPVRDRAFKNKIGERKEVVMSIVVMRQKVESAVDKQTPSEDRYPLRMQ